MKSKLLSLILILVTTFSQAQTVDEIVDSYIEAVGGKSFLRNLEGLRMTGTFYQSGIELPFEQVIYKDGRQYTEITFNGNTFRQNVYDGKVLWGTDFATFKPKISNAEETANFRLDMNDFPDVLLDYKPKNYSVDLMGKVEKQGRQTYKIRVKREDKSFDGVSFNDISYYYLDVVEKVSICQETTIQNGPSAGQLQTLIFSDYDLIDNQYLIPLNIKQTADGQTVFEMIITKVELNPVVSNSEFVMTQ